jgi:phosphate transport system substrate-binding protein
MIMKRFVVGLVALAVAAVFTAPAFAAKVMQIKGSDTLINMVQRIAEVYMEENPGKVIAVTGGGSGTGVAALVNKSCDIADASRSIKDTEMAQAVANGVDVKRVVVAIDALSVIVNDKNPVKKLTLEEIGKIYRGEVKNWKDLGGEDGPITLYGRQPNSGTYDFMKENVLKAEYSGKMNQMNGNAQIVEAVKQDKGGIGYVGIGYLKEATGVTAVKVALKAGGTYVDPLNIAAVKAGEYPITRALNQYINGTPKGDVLDFIRFELSKEGQEIVEEEGFFPLNEEYISLNSWITGA